MCKGEIVMDDMKETVVAMATLLGVGIAVVNVLPDDVSVEKTVNVEKTATDKLREAAELGDVEAFNKFLSDDADINYQDSSTGKTILMMAIEQNGSVMRSGNACEIVEKALQSGKVDLTLKDNQGFSLADYVDKTVSNLNDVSGNYVTPQTYGVGRAAEKLSTRWKAILKKIHNMDKKDARLSPDKTNFYAFIQAQKGRSL